MKQKNRRFEKKEQEPVILSGISLKHAEFVNDKGKKQTACFIEIKGDDLWDQVEFENTNIEIGKDKDGYDIKYRIMFTSETNMEAFLKTATDGFYTLVSNNMWIDKREGYDRILRVAQVEKFECYYKFENK